MNPHPVSALTIEQTYEAAAGHHQAGRLVEAEALCRQILSKNADHWQTMELLARLEFQSGRRDEALELLRRVVMRFPQVPAGHLGLGTVCALMGRLGEAVAAYRRAVALRPDLVEGWFNLGNALRIASQHDEAIVAYQRALALRPQLPAIHNNLGNALKAKNRFDEAIASYRRALGLQPAYPEAHYNLGCALQETGELDAAIEAYRQAIKLRPDYAQALNNLGSALQSNQESDQAIECFRRAVKIRPDYVEAKANLANALKDTGCIDEALTCLREMQALRPGPGIAGMALYALHFHPDYDAKRIGQEHAKWNQTYALPLAASIQPHENDRDPGAGDGSGRRLRVGYVSPYLQEHIVARYLLPLLANHDRGRFEIHCYADVARPDAITRRLRGHADVWRDTFGWPDERVTSLIRQDRIDVLVDLSMHMDRNRLLVFARKPAPVQVIWLAYPSTTGLTTIDYRLSDPYLDPPGPPGEPGPDDRFYSERTIRLPNSYWCYAPPIADLAVNPLPASSAGFVTFASLNMFGKVTDPAVELWGKVMMSVPGSRLLVLAPEGSARQRLLERLGKWGVEPARVEFVNRQPQRSYLELYHRIDISLDTYPCSGHTTGLDSLWMGVPVVTLTGRTAMARAGWSVLANAGLSSLVAHTPDQYLRIATELAADLPALANLRSTLRQRMESSPLMDAPRFARDIETAYRQMWRNWATMATASSQ